jgi:hypothetical protein
LWDLVFAICCFSHLFSQRAQLDILWRVDHLPGHPSSLLSPHSSPLSLCNSVGLQISSVAPQPLVQGLWNSTKTKISSLNPLTQIHLHPLPSLPLSPQPPSPTLFLVKDPRMNMRLLLILRSFTVTQTMLILPHRRCVTSACPLEGNYAISNHKIPRRVSWRSCMAMARTNGTPGSSCPFYPPLYCELLLMCCRLCSF